MLGIFKTLFISSIPLKLVKKLQLILNIFNFDKLPVLINLLNVYICLFMYIYMSIWMYICIYINVYV